MKMLHVTIQTARFEEEIAFYRDIVGLTIRRETRRSRSLRMPDRPTRAMPFCPSDSGAGTQRRSAPNWNRKDLPPGRWLPRDRE